MPPPPIEIRKGVRVMIISLFFRPLEIEFEIWRLNPSPSFYRSGRLFALALEMCANTQHPFRHWVLKRKEARGHV